MKKLICTISFLLILISASFAQDFPPFYFEFYQNAWEQVDKNIKEKKPNEALVIVDSIYERAKRANHHGHYLKAILFRLDATNNYSDGDAIQKSINKLNCEIENASEPQVQILYSVKAEILWSYYQYNRYRILKRTNTVNYQKEDISTWNLRSLVKEVTNCFRLSLRNDSLLKSTGLGEYQEILISNYGVRDYRPTLYDILIHRGIDYFMNEEPDLVRPAATFYLDNPTYLSPANDFLSIKITSPDSLSMKFYALQLLQDAIRFHMRDHNPKALIDVDLKRLNFVKRNAIFADNDSLYVESLKSLFNQYPDNSEVASVCYNLANFYNIEASKYDSLTNPKSQNYYLEALKYIDYANNNYTSSLGSGNSSSIKNQILTQELSQDLEHYSIPDAPTKMKVDFRNIKTFYTRIIPCPKTMWDSLDNSCRSNSDCLVQKITQLPYLTQTRTELPFPQDHQNRSVEIGIQPLPVGEYIILSSNDEEFYFPRNILTYSKITVTNLAYIDQVLNNGSHLFTVVDRKTGAPVKNAKVKVKYSYFDYYPWTVMKILAKYLMSSSDDYEYEYGLPSSVKRTTDENGQCLIPLINKEVINFHDRYNYEEDDDFWDYFDFLEDKVFYFHGYSISKDGEKLETDKNKYLSHDYSRTIYKSYKRSKHWTYFFTDRAIYRPGQTVYFKGIILESKRKNAKLSIDKKTTVKLFDSNRQEKYSMELTSNDFGSFQGSFVIPEGVTGRLEISNEFGSEEIQVEEYKRPKFEAMFNPVKGTYRLNENVTVSGIAKAYAGNTIDGANVKYRVTREASYPFWYGWRGTKPTSNSMEITNGNVITNEKGEFTIVFNAIPDFSTDKRLLPQFNYKITADITDINGETHSATTNIQVGYVSTSIFVSLPPELDQAKAPEPYDLRTTNLNYQLEPSNISVKVTRLIPPMTFYKNRLWTRPTSYVYSKEEFTKLFPNDEYRSELEKSTWEKGEISYQRNHNTASDTILKFENISSWKSGDYIIEIKGVDKFGVEFEKIQYFSVLNSAKTENQLYTDLRVTTSEFRTMPGKTVKITIESSHADADVFVEYTQYANIFHKQWVKLDKNVKQLELPITKDLYGSISINVIMVANNRIYSSSAKILVEEKEETIDVTFASFRDKLSPGQEEEWRLTIKGSNGQKVAAELMATMYDASLDAFKTNDWSSFLSSKYSNYWYDPDWKLNDFNNIVDENKYDGLYKNNSSIKWINYERLINYNGRTIESYGGSIEGSEIQRAVGRSAEGIATSMAGVQGNDGYMGSVRGSRTDGTVTYIDGVKVAGTSSLPKSSIQEIDMITGGVPAKYGEASGGILSITSSIDTKPIQVRKNFNETAFFMPQLATDTAGNIVIKFKVPESLTRWKVMGLAHTKDLRFGGFIKELVTQKELMVVPNQPRFFREGDNMEFNAKISNISDKDLIGIAKIEFFDALTMKPINSELGLTTLEIPFSTLKGQSTSVAWKIAIPQGLMAITYRVTAQAGNFSDGEEMTLPVLTNRMLVTESLPLPINGNQTKTFSFDKLKNNTSITLKNFKYTLEFTSNPAWYAIQSLPYLMEYPYECSEQTFNRFYANSIAYHIANSNPKIKAVFESWKINSPEALISNLEKNQELKSIMIEETPWVFDSKNQAEQKKRLGLLFDIVKMSNQLDATLNKLVQKQSYKGSWAWFPGMRENQYISQYIIAGFGHLKMLGINNFKTDIRVFDMIYNGVKNSDEQIRNQYDTLVSRKTDLSLNHTSTDEIQYLYARTFFLTEVIISPRDNNAFNYYLNQTKTFWKDRSIYMQAMIAIINFKTGDQETAKKIMASIKDRAIYSEEMGMYWQNEGTGYFWHEAPIERQALLIEAFDLITNDQESVEKMKIWLLKQKQTQNWGTTKSTAEACYALLLKGTSQLTDDQLVEIKIGDKVIDPKKMDNVKVEAGTGYFKTAWNGTEITPNMGNITVTKSTAGVAWGSVYWQYFENLDKITPAATPLSMKKELFIVRATPTGEVIEPVKAGDKIKVGDKIRVRIVLRSDRDMEYVHMKDMRAAAFEPINVLSQYKYQDGLGYYESTRDAATNFFFDYLRKGTYVFEYTLFATQKGDFSNGITTIQCMYAPEFTSHSEGVRVVVE